MLRRSPATPSRSTFVVPTVSEASFLTMVRKGTASVRCVDRASISSTRIVMPSLTTVFAPGLMRSSESKRTSASRRASWTVRAVTVAVVRLPPTTSLMSLGVDISRSRPSRPIALLREADRTASPLLRMPSSLRASPTLVAVVQYSRSLPSTVRVSLRP